VHTRKSACKSVEKISEKPLPEVYAYTLNNKDFDYLLNLVQKMRGVKDTRVREYGVDFDNRFIEACSFFMNRVEEMANSIYDSERFDTLKKMLIDQYHSQLMAHAGYILALIIGALTLISRLDTFLGLGSFGVISIFLLVSAIIGMIVYFASRLFYWNCLENLSFAISEKDFVEYHKANVERGACLANLQLFIACESLSRIRKSPVTFQNRIACRSVRRQVIDSALIGSVAFMYLLAFGFLR
jgi:hypothetical protein